MCIYENCGLGVKEMHNAAQRHFRHNFAAAIARVGLGARRTLELGANEGKSSPRSAAN